MAFELFSDAKGQARVAKGVRKRTRAQAQPKFLLDLIRLFSPQFMALLAPQLNASMSGTRSELGRRGLTGTGFGQATLAGIPGQFGLEAFRQALEQSNVSQQRLINTELGAPLPPAKQSNIGELGQLFDIFGRVGGALGNGGFGSLIQQPGK